MNEPLNGKTVLITGAARRVGRILALACGRAGADVMIHHGHSPQQALDVEKKIASFGRRAWVLASDLSRPESATGLISRANEIQPLDALVNSAAIFESLSWESTTFEDWQRHMDINLTAPFLLSQEFAKQFARGGIHAAGDGGGSRKDKNNGGGSDLGNVGRIVNILDWRALRPGADHFPYTVSKAALAAMTKSLAVALAPRITVNGLALGAILPPVNDSGKQNIIEHVPAHRWGEADEVGEALIFLLSGPSYITGEIIHVDGGRHLI